MSKSKKKRRNVVVILSNVKQYRKVFYEQLHETLAASDVDLTVLYSDSNQIVALRRDDIDLPPPIGRKIPRLYLFNNRIFLQFPPLSVILRADLVIIVQASRYLLNYPLLALSALGLKRIAFWGHGKNHQGDPNTISERIKRHLANSSNWWFAYTKETQQHLVSIGVSPCKISVVENAVDTTGFRKEVRSVTPADMALMRMRLGIKDNNPVALYCGALYQEKCLPFLLDCADLIAAAIPGFHLIVIGGGPEADFISRQAASRPHVCYLGPLVGHEKAVCFRMSQVFLMPGLVGLAILDSFAANLPLITTVDALHSPEIAYLEHEMNGLMLPGHRQTYADGVVELLRDMDRLEFLSMNAGLSATRYTVENMVANVTKGIITIFMKETGESIATSNKETSMINFKQLLRAAINPIKFLRQSKVERRHELVGSGHLWKMKREFQITFLKKAGLLPRHYLVDIGCGTLRGGIPLINYLDKGHYYGIETREVVLNEARKELLESGLNKTPSLLLSDDISKLEIDTKFDFIWSFSVLIHMPDKVLNDCLLFVAKHLQDTGVMYANVNIGSQVNEKWQGFPVVYKSLDFYIDAGLANNLKVSDIGSIKDFGHITGIELQDNQRMLKIEKIANIKAAV